MRKDKLFYISLIAAMAAAFFIGCARSASQDAKVLAKVSNKSISLRDFKKRVSKLPAYYQEMVKKNRKRFLDEVIVEMLFYEEAVRRSLDRETEVKEVLSEAKKKILIAKFIKNEVEDKIDMDESELRQLYEARKDEFKTEELWRASHILVASEDEAKDILDEISKGAGFEELAKTRSIDATASRGGDVGYFRKGQLVPDFENACLKLNIGETSPIVHTQFGFHIIRLTDKKPPSIEEFEKVRRVIEDELKRKKRSELFDKLVLGLKEKYNVKIEEDVFESLERLDEAKGERIR